MAHTTHGPHFSDTEDHTVWAILCGPQPPANASDVPSVHALNRGLCITTLFVQPLPALLLLLLALLGALRWLVCSRPATHPQDPQGKWRRDRTLWLAALACAGACAVCALVTLLLALLLPASWPHAGPPGHLPKAWLSSPLFELLAAGVSVLILYPTHESGRAPRGRLVVGTCALLQAGATIAVMMLTSTISPGFVLVATLCRVGACCALTLTALWPNRRMSATAGAVNSDFVDHPEGGSATLTSPMAAALLRQVDDAACNAAAHRRQQRDVWAEWLSYSSAQIAGLTGNGSAQTNGTTTCSSINYTLNDGGSSCDGRNTHETDDLGSFAGAGTNPLPRPISPLSPRPLPMRTPPSLSLTLPCSPPARLPPSLPHRALSLGISILRFLRRLRLRPALSCSLCGRLAHRWPQSRPLARSVPCAQRPPALSQAHSERRCRPIPHDTALHGTPLRRTSDLKCRQHCWLHRRRCVWRRWTGVSTA